MSSKKRARIEKSESSTTQEDGAGAGAEVFVVKDEVSAKICVDLKTDFFCPICQDLAYPVHWF